MSRTFNGRRRGTITVLLAAALTTGTLAVASPAQAAGAVTAVASADSFGSAAQPTTVNGSLIYGVVDDAPIVSWVKFDVTGIPAGAPVTSATLTLTGTGDAQTTQTVTVNSLPNTWTESTTYSTRPTPGAAVGTGSMGTNLVMNVSVPISGNGTYSFAVTRAAAGGSNVLTMRESAQTAKRPKLVVNYGDVAGTPAPPGPAPVTAPAPSGASILGYGAVANDAGDDAPALRAALAANQTVYIPAGNYVLGSFMSPRQTRLNADFVASLKTGQKILADPGAKLKFANGVISNSTAVWGGNLFIADGTSDVTVQGGDWDFNGANNPDTAAKDITGYGVYTYGANRTTVQDVTFRNTPGQNYIVMQNRGDGFKVLNSSFLNGGTSLAGNTAQVDYSAGYFTGANVTIDHVAVANDLEPFTYSGGMELHGTLNSFTNSTVKKSWPAVYIGPDVTSNLTRMDNTVVTGNQFTDVGRGVVFNAQGTGDIAGVKIRDNTIRLRGFAGLGPTRGVDQDAPPDNNWTYHHNITGLDLGNNKFYDDDGKSDSMVTLSQIQGGTIAGNTMTAVPSAIFRLGGSPAGTSNVTYSGNTVDWIGTSGAPAMIISTAPYAGNNIQVTGNNITLRTARGGSCAVYVDGSPLTGSGVKSNTFTRIETPVCGPQAGAVAYVP